MPELPDVEIYKRCLDAHGLGRRIDRVHVRDRRLLEQLSAATMQRRLKSTRLQRSRRHGKLLFASVAGGNGSLLMHFGMTGRLEPYQKGDDVPPYSAVIFDFVDGGRLAYVSRRKLGRLGLVADVDKYLNDKRLGPDALADDLDLRAFRGALTGRSASIKAVLMDQSVIAGIGNVYSDEMLLRARVHPESRANRLDAKTTRALYRAMRYVLGKAIEADADPDRMPRSFLLPHRRAGAPCPRCDGRVEKRTVAGRSAYLCPACQPRTGGD